MAKLKFAIHPLFFIFGLYFAWTGRVFIFLIYTIVAVIHEIGHSMVASKLGYKLNKIVLMPYGAVVSGEISGLRFRDEIRVALAGPLVNIACAVAFASLWWVFPETYAYTDVAMVASLSIATINLLPCRPLDGGRILHSFLSIYLSKSTADIVLKVTGVLFSCVLVGLFIFSCFRTVNFSLLFFALFAFFGTVFPGRQNRYVKIFENSYAKLINRGAEVKTVAVSSSITVRQLLQFLDEDCLTEVCVFNNDGEQVLHFTPNEVCSILSGDTLYAKLVDLK